MARVHDTIATIELHDSPARFVGPGRIDVGGHIVQTRSTLLATGSRPALPPVEGLAEVGPLTSDSLWDLTDMPDRLVVLGDGPIGCELGQACARLGSRVTIVEMADRLVPTATPAAGQVLACAPACCPPPPDGSRVPCCSPCATPPTPGRDPREGRVRAPGRRRRHAPGSSRRRSRRRPRPARPWRRQQDEQRVGDHGLGSLREAAGKREGAFVLQARLHTASPGRLGWRRRSTTDENARNAVPLT